MPRSTRILLALLPWLVALPSWAGIFFQPVTGPAGADVAALASDNDTIWAATYRGVWRLSAGAWKLDALGDRNVTSVAVSGGTVWAATGEALYRRSADGSWAQEPVAVDQPEVLFTDGASLVVGGTGVARRSLGSWVVLPSPDGRVTALTSFSGDLFAGVAGRGAARLSGGAWVPMAAGMGSGESARALTPFGGLLFAGTSRGLYAWLGSSWVFQDGFGSHNVQALAVLAGDLAAATLDGGVIVRSGSVWGTRNIGLRSASARCFASVGSDVYLGTAGGPIVRWNTDRWTMVGEGPGGAIVSGFADVCVPGPISCEWAIGTRGSGIGGITLNALPDGCGEVRSLVAPGWGTLLAATNCGLLIEANAKWSPAGLPSGADPISLAISADGSAWVGTSNAGVFKQDGGVWNSRSEGLPGTAPVALERVGNDLGADLYAVAGGALYRLSPNGAWTPGPGGLPVNARIRALGAVGNEPIVALADGSVLRHDEAVGWIPDAIGLETSSVRAFGGYPWPSGLTLAAAGTGGFFRRTMSGWVSENAGLPPGADVQVADVSFSGVARVGTAGHGAFEGRGADALTVPVLLDTHGAAGSRFRTEIAFGNRTTETSQVAVRFNPAAASSFTPSEGTFSIGAGAEVRASDALEFLRGIGLSIPVASPSSPVVGSLSIPWSPNIDVTTRTFTGGADGGSYGLSYAAVSDLDAAEDVAAVYGLRSQAGVARSNLAVVHVAGRSGDPVTLAVQVYAADGSLAGGPSTKTLQPGEWFQWNEVLRIAGLPDGASGYARITRTAGIGPWIAYGIVNDDATSDGSYLAMQRPGGLGATRRQIVPVVLDLFGAAGSHYTTELTLANDGPSPTSVELTYQSAPGFGSVPGVPTISVTVAAHAQVILPDVLQAFRDRGIAVPRASDGGTAGTLVVDFRYLTKDDVGTTLALARTTTPNTDTSTGGAFGVSYPAVAIGGGARTASRVPALREDAASRSNLAVVHAGGGSSLPLSLSVQLFDAGSGDPVGNRLGATLQPGEWKQWSQVMRLAGVPSSVPNTYAVITRTEGDDTFFAYGVVNDAITSDGSYVAGIPADRS